MDLANYQNEVKKILEQVIRVSDDQFGYSDDELHKAEKRLGYPIPGALRFMYRYIGKHELWRDSHHALVRPQNLKVDDGKLQILIECKNVVEIFLLEKDLHEINPPVYQRQPADPENIYKEDELLDQYMLMGLCWELVMIGEELKINYDGLSMFHGESMSHDQAKLEVADMTLATVNSENAEWSTAAYFGDRKVAYLFVADEQTLVYSWEEFTEEE